MANQVFTPSEDDVREARAVVRVARRVEHGVRGVDRRGELRVERGGQRVEALLAEGLAEGGRGHRRGALPRDVVDVFWPSFMRSTYSFKLICSSPDLEVW